MAWFDRVSVLAVTVVAALLRVPGIDSRGRFDADQGHDMLTLLAFTRDGVIPLLGPKTSVGEFHHGAFYYFLLAPAAAISDADPTVVTLWLAILGIAAVPLTWWLGRSIAGGIAGLLAGGLLAISPAAIEESTFIWNPNPIGFFAALALAAAWRGHRGGRVAWWAVALGAAGAVVQLHVLGIVFLLPIVILSLVHLRRDRRTWRGIAGGIALIVVLFLPLAIHELQTGFLETQRLLDYVRGGDPGPDGGPASAIAFTLLRVVGWPLVGLVTDVPAVAALLLALAVGLVGWRLLRARGSERTGLALLVGLLVWSTLALAFAAPSLQRVVAGLPNDHYHAFLDPIVVLLIGASAAGLVEPAIALRRSGGTGGGVARGPALFGATLGFGAITAFGVAAVLRMPPAPDPDGGWAAAQAAGERIVQQLHGPPTALVSLPDFKSADGIEFPIRDAVRRLPPGVSPGGMVSIVVVCDRLFESQIGAACGGPAEDRFMFGDGAAAPDPVTGIPVSTRSLVDRFDASARTSISIYTPVVTP